MNQYRELSQLGRWEHEFRHPASAVWPFLADTDRQNRAMGLPPIRSRFEPKEGGGARRFCEGKFGPFRASWEEHPYEWTLYRSFSVCREYRSGPLLAMNLSWEFEDRETGCQVTQSLSFDPRWKLLAPLIRSRLLKAARIGFLESCRQVEEYLDGQTASPFRPALGDQPVVEGRVREELKARLARARIDGELVAPLAEFIIQAQVPELGRMRPFELADRLGLDRMKTLSAFFRGTREGIFRLSWGLLCPSCRGAKVTVGTLSQLSRDVHCESCGIDYSVDLERYVELAFTLSPTIRKIDVADYCIGSPRRTSHRLAQVRVPPEGTVLFHDFRPGTYLLRSPAMAHRYRLQVGDETTAAGSPIAIMVEPSNTPRTQELSLDQGAREIHIENGCGAEALLILEDESWADDACTAARVTNLQEFRDLFSAEVLRPGQEIGLQALALMFTDLRGSTATYQRIGDPAAFALVQDHFEILMDCVRRNDGCVVKTIGDAVMASFLRPVHATKAAMEIQAEVAAHNAATAAREPIVVKIGIHFGPCLAVNLDERLDYFGTTVNIAARTEGQSAGGDLVLSHRMMQDPEVARLVAAAGYPVEKIAASLKGFGYAFELYRIRCSSVSELATDSGVGAR